MTDVAPGFEHAHAWSAMAFELVDDRPVVRQQCHVCGLVRRYRAWERYWTPDAGEARASTTDHSVR